MQSRTIQFRTIAVLILLIAATPLFAARDKSGGKKSDQKKRPQARQQQRENYMHPRAEGLIPEALKEKLNLTDEQKAQLAKIHKEQDEKIKKLSGKMLELRKKITEAVVEEAKESEIRKIAAEMGATIGDMAVIRSSGYAVLSDILSEEQFEIIAKFREKSGKGAENFKKRMKSQHRGRRGEPGKAQKRGQGAQPDSQKIFDKKDANSDGKLTPEEMGGEEKSKRFFDKFDTNEDEVVTIEEFSKIARQQSQKKGNKTKRGQKNDGN